MLLYVLAGGLYTLVLAGGGAIAGWKLRAALAEKMHPPEENGQVTAADVSAAWQAMQTYSIDDVYGVSSG